MKTTSKIPVIKLGKSKVVEDVTGKAAKIIKSKVKSKAKPKTKGKGKRGRKPAPDLTRVPTNMVPPDIPDSRPVYVPEPEPDAEPSAPGPAVGEPELDDAPITVAEMESAKPVQAPASVDTRLFQGATCTWIGPMEDAPDHPDTGKPVCPHCKNNLLTCPDRATIELGAEQYELGAYEAINPAPRRHPGYKGLLQWIMDQSREKCWATIEEAADAYHTATGKLVDPAR